MGCIKLILKHLIIPGALEQYPSSTLTPSPSKPRSWILRLFQDLCIACVYFLNSSPPQILNGIDIWFSLLHLQHFTKLFCMIQETFHSTNTSGRAVTQGSPYWWQTPTVQRWVDQQNKPLYPPPPNTWLTPVPFLAGHQSQLSRGERDQQNKPLHMYPLTPRHD